MRYLDGITDSIGHEFEQVPGDGEGQGSLACCIPWGRKESDTTEQLNNNNKFSIILILLFWVCLCIFKEYYCFTFIFFWLHWAACGILVPPPRIEPDPLTVKAPSPKHCTAREFPSFGLIFMY